MQDLEIIEKLRKLLRLARSSNANEAALAMQRALELATKHQVNISDIDPDAESARIRGDYIPTPSRLAREYVEALNIAHRFFHVHITVISGGAKCLVVGTELDIELAQYVVVFLVRSCRASVAAWKQEERKARRKTTGPKVAAFIDAWFIGVRVKLSHQEQREHEASASLALTLDNGRKARADFSHAMLDGKRTKVIATKTRTNRRAQLQGFVAGQETQINPGLKGGQQPLAIT